MLSALALDRLCLQGVTRLAADESVADLVMADAKGAAQAVQALLLAAQSTGGELRVQRTPCAANARLNHGCDTLGLIGRRNPAVGKADESSKADELERFKGKVSEAMDAVVRSVEVRSQAATAHSNAGIEP